MAYSREWYQKVRADPEKREAIKIRARESARRRAAFHKGQKRPKRKLPEPNALPGIPLSRLMAGR